MHIRSHLQRAGVDVDKPVGFFKLKWRRWLRRQIARWTRKEVEEATAR